ncbi:MAG TPA: hypothetical protein VGL77_01610 [Armatimonadota bacterium]|jgi:hypothetical protein
MFLIYTLADLRCLRNAQGAPPGLLDEIERSLREVHLATGATEPLDAFTMQPYGGVLILQAGDGPSVYTLVDDSDGLIDALPPWIGQRASGDHVTYQVLHLRGKNRQFRLYLPHGVAKR